MKRYVFSVVYILMSLTLAAQSGLSNGAPANVEAVDLGLPSGTKWANMNVGASSPEEYGAYFAWGEISPKSSYSWDNYMCPKNSCGEPGDPVYDLVGDKADIAGTKLDAAKMNWGASWNMPTAEQIEELASNCNSTLVTINGVQCRKLTSKINGNEIIFPLAGSKWFDSFAYEGTSCYYWGSTLRQGGYVSPCRLIVRDYVHGWGWSMGGENDRYCGYPIRPVMSPAGTSLSLTIDCDTLEFGNVKVGEKLTRSFYIINNSDNTQTIQDFSKTNPDFTFSWTGGNLSSKEKKKVDVTYIPSNTTYDVGAWIVIGTSEMHESGTCLKVTFKASSIDESKQKRTHLVVLLKDKSKVSFNLQDEPIMGHKNGKLVITSTRSVTEFDVSNIRNLSYVDGPTEIEEVDFSDGQDNTPFIRNGESFTFFPGGKDLKVQISTVGGIAVSSFTIPKETPTTISLGALHPGVYMIRMNEITYKTIIR